MDANGATEKSEKKSNHLELAARAERSAARREKVAQIQRRADFFGALELQGGERKSRSRFFDPTVSYVNNWEGGVQTFSPHLSRGVSAGTLRLVSRKAAIVNLCIQNLIKKIRPFLKRATGENLRGWRITSRRSLDEADEMTGEERGEARRLCEFLENTGDADDDEREDDFETFCVKSATDLCVFDQIAVEVQRNNFGEVCAFWAADAGTIERATPKTRSELGIRYAQIINGRLCAVYEKGQMLFDCANPQADVERNGYGFSIVEKALDFLTAQIQAFVYNTGFFTENRLPRGILTMPSDPNDTETIEVIEDKLLDVMSGNAQALWRIPVIPSGQDGQKIEFVQMSNPSNNDMQFQSWFDFLVSGIVGMFGFSMEDLGLHSSKSQTMFAENTAPKIQASKSLVVGDMLSFLQKQVNKVLQMKNPDFAFEFVGYERDDPKATLDLDKGEVECYKSLNEKRAEKNLEALDFAKIENPADLPMNPHAIAAWQAAKGGGGMGMEGGEGEFEGEAGDGGGFDWGEGAAVEKSFGRAVIRV